MGIEKEENWTGVTVIVVGAREGVVIIVVFGAERVIILIVIIVFDNGDLGLSYRKARRCRIVHPRKIKEE